MSAPVRVLVVDDSAFARKVVREVLSRDARVEVVGIARDGLEALELVPALRPDVLTLDLVMPNLDGLGVLRALPPELRRRVVVLSVSHEDAEIVVEALSLGAFDFVRKPTSLATQRLYDVGAPLLDRVLAAAGTAVDGARTGADEGVPPPPAPAPEVDLVVVGTSTGGPQALSRVIPALPAGLAAPLAIAVHIPEEYTAAMAERLDRGSHVRVVESSDGLALRPGTAVLARGGAELEIHRAGERLVARAAAHPERPYHPSVDVLFESAARACRGRVLAVVLTGMGDDGLAGCRAVRAAGGQVVIERADTAVVYGMPRAVAEAGLANAAVPLDAIAAEIVRRIGRG